MPLKGAVRNGNRQPVMAVSSGLVTGRSFRRGLTLGLLGGAAVTAARLFQERRPTPTTAPAPPVEWPPIAVDVEAAPAPELEPIRPTPWVDPLEDGSCPTSHPVKGKLMSGIYHVVGGFNYPRAKADRCYLDIDAAEADGLRASKR